MHDNSVQHLDADSNERFVGVEVRKLIVEVAIENDDIGITLAPDSRPHRRQTQRIQETQCDAYRREIPSLYVLIATLNWFAGSAYSFVAFENGVAQIFPQ